AVAVPGRSGAGGLLSTAAERMEAIDDVALPADDDPTPVQSALRRAKELEEAGRGFEAVDLLVEATRRYRHPELQRVLVLARHAALDDLDPPAGLDTWPPTYPDPFPGVAGPPEIDIGELTPEILGGAMVNHGSLIV